MAKETKPLKIDIETHEKLKALADNQDRTMGGVVRRLVAKEYENMEKDK